MQRSAYVSVASIRNLTKLITKIFRKDGADLICLASVVRLCPGIEFCSNSRSSFPLCQCGKGPREQHDGTSRPPHERVHHSLTLHFVCPLHPLTLQQGSLCRCFLRNICDLVQTLANQPNICERDVGSSSPSKHTPTYSASEPANVSAMNSVVFVR